MGDKVYELVISVDLGCCRCRRPIQDYLCQLQRKQCNRIVAIAFDEKNNAVLVSGHFDREQLKRKLLCKFPKIINGIDIREPLKDKPKPDPDKEKFMSKCLEKYEKIRKCTEKCKKECEEKCRTECEKKIKCKCDCEKKEDPPKPPVHPWPPLVVCCPRPCPCFTPWSNIFRCCSCGVESWPGMCGPGWGSGPSPWGRPQWGNCESSQPAIILESTVPSCSIM